MKTEVAGASRRMTLVVAVLLCVWSPSLSQRAQSSARTSDRAKITAMIRSWEEAWNTHDMHAFANLFHEDGVWVLWTGQVWKGRMAIEEGHVAVHKTVFRNSQLRTLGQSVRLLAPQVAVAHVDWEMTGHDMSHIKDWSLSEVRQGVLTAVLVSEGDTWRIAALHNTDTVPALGPGK